MLYPLFVPNRSSENGSAGSHQSFYKSYSVSSFSNGKFTDKFFFFLGFGFDLFLRNKTKSKLYSLVPFHFIVSRSASPVGVMSVSVVVRVRLSQD